MLCRAQNYPTVLTKWAAPISFWEVAIRNQRPKNDLEIGFYDLLNFNILV